MNSALPEANHLIGRTPQTYKRILNMSNASLSNRPSFCLLDNRLLNHPSLFKRPQVPLQLEDLALVLKPN
jgi:hypothetical protein